MVPVVLGARGEGEVRREEAEDEEDGRDPEWRPIDCTPTVCPCRDVGGKA